MSPTQTIRWEFTLNGNTPEEQWGSLLSLLCAACQSKQENGNWPLFIGTNAGSIAYHTSESTPSTVPL